MRQEISSRVVVALPVGALVGACIGSRRLRRSVLDRAIIDRALINTCRRIYAAVAHEIALRIALIGNSILSECRIAENNQAEKRKC